MASNPGGAVNTYTVNDSEFEKISHHLAETTIIWNHGLSNHFGVSRNLHRNLLTFLYFPRNGLDLLPVVVICHPTPTCSQLHHRPTKLPLPSHRSFLRQCLHPHLHRRTQISQSRCAATHSSNSLRELVQLERWISIMD